MEKIRIGGGVVVILGINVEEAFLYGDIREDFWGIYWEDKYFIKGIGWSASLLWYLRDGWTRDTLRSPCMKVVWWFYETPKFYKPGKGQGLFCRLVVCAMRESFEQICLRGRQQAGTFDLLPFEFNSHLNTLISSVTTLGFLHKIGVKCEMILFLLKKFNT